MIDEATLVTLGVDGRFKVRIPCFVECDGREQIVDQTQEQWFVLVDLSV